MIRFHTMNIDTSSHKIGSFITSILCLLIAGFLAFVCFDLGQTIHAQTGLEALSQIVTIPILIVLYLAFTSLVISSIISSIFALFSTYKAIKIISIILLIVGIAVLGFEVYTLILVI